MSDRLLKAENTTLDIYTELEAKLAVPTPVMVSLTLGHFPFDW